MDWTDLERAFFGDPYADIAASSLQMLLSFDVTREREYIAGRDSVADSRRDSAAASA